jgi:DNA-binding transcriptional LysR family regulator
MDRFKLMTTYESVVRLGGYTPAAKELGVTRAMVSKRIFELERVLNVRLLNRTTQRIGTTASGVDYYKSCVSVLADVRGIEERLVARRRDAKGELRILSSKTLGEIILAPILARFCSDYPGIRPHLVLRELGSDEHDLISRGFDLSVRPQDVKISSLVARPIIALPRIIVAAPSYIERNGAPATPADLTSHNCLTSNGENHYDWEFLGPKGRVTVHVSGTFRSSSNSVIRHAALRGVGLALVGEYVVEADIKAGRLTRVLDGYTLPERMLHVLYQKDRYQPLRARLFINYLAKSVKEREAVATP